MEPADAWRMTERLKNELGKGDPFAAAVRATRMPMVITDPRQDDNPIVFCNEAFMRLTGFRREEIYGRNCRFLQGPDTDGDEVARLRAAVDVRTDVDVELLNYRKDGTTFWNALYVSPVFNESGEMLYFFASQLDVTRRREAEQRRREDKARTEQEARDRACEPQNSAAAPHGGAGSAASGDAGPAVDDDLRMLASLVSSQADAAAQPAVRDTLRSVLGRLEALSTAHRRERTQAAGPVEVARLARDLVSDLAAGREDVAVRLDVRPAEVAAGQAGPVALIVAELVSNALRHAFTDGRAGRLTVAASADDGRLRVEVADDGVGMDAAPATPGAYGLTLVRTLARRLGGEITWANAAPGVRAVLTAPLTHPGEAATRWRA